MADRPREAFQSLLGIAEDEACLSVRPAVSSSVYLAAGLWSGIGVVYGCLEHYDAFFALCSLVISVFGIIALLLALWRCRRKAITCLLVGFCLGGVCASVAALDYGVDMEEAIAAESGLYEFSVIEDASRGDFGMSCCAETKLASGRKVAVRLDFDKEETRYRYGERFVSFTTFRKPSEAAASHYYREGLAAHATVYSTESVALPKAFGVLVDFRQRALACFDGYSGEGAAFLRAVLFGERSDLTEGGFYAAVKVCGLAHIIAVSGAHLVVVSSLIGICLRALRANLWMTIVMQLVFIGCYLIFTGFPISAFRAALMSVISMTAVMVGRRSSGAAALAVCACVMLGSNVHVAYSISFALSVAATFGIVFFGGLMRDWCKRGLRLQSGFVCDALSLTLASNLLTLPLAAATFSQVSLIAPVANVLASPLFALFCGGGLLAVVVYLVVPAFGAMIVNGLVVGAQAFCEGVILLAQVPFASVPFSGDLSVLLIAAGVFLVVLWVWWPQPSLRACVTFGVSLCLFGCVSVGVLPRFAPDELVMLDIGQGDAFLVRSRGSTLLVDTGNQDRLLLRGLAQQGIYHLDAVAISHPDDDHCASLLALQALVPVDRVLVAQDLLSCPCDSCKKLRFNAEQLVGHDGLLGIGVGDSLKFGIFTARMIAPQSFSDEGGNADSLCLLLDADVNGDGWAEWRTLLCGDAEESQIAQMIESKALGDIDIYKVGHHGSKHALTPEEAMILRPEIALVSVGKNNRYGHPAPSTLDTLSSVGTRVFRTDEQGEVVCRFLFDRIEVDALR